MVHRFYMTKELRKSTSVLAPNCYDVTNKGRKTKHLIAKLIRKGVLKQHFDESVSVTYVEIDTDKLLDRLLACKRELMRSWNREGQMLIIGSDDYHELMGTPMPQFVSCNMSAPYVNGDGHHYFLNMRVHIVPWMRGLVII